MLATVKLATRNSCGGMTGTGCVRTRWTSNATAVAVITADSNVHGEPHPQFSALTRPSESAPTAIAIAPTGSGTRVREAGALLGSMHVAIANAIRPMGRLMRNAHRHEFLASRPPMTGPAPPAKEEVVARPSQRRHAAPRGAR